MTNLSEIDMVVLKRNDVNDATHEDKDDPEFKYRLIDNHWHVITDGNPVWRKDSIDLNEAPLFIKPIEKNMNTLDTDQDEPFLTPECTLNDQYAEIEKARQVEIHGTVKANPDFNFGAAQAVGGVDATLSQRQSQYGCYEDVAHVTQQILSALRIGNYDELPAPMKESLHMIASKMARIVNGDPEYLDNWHDIGGYAKLIEKLIEGE